jgi:hypothetical protein
MRRRIEELSWRNGCGEAVIAMGMSAEQLAFWTRAVELNMNATSTKTVIRSAERRVPNGVEAPRVPLHCDKTPRNVYHGGKDVPLSPDRPDLKNT